MTAPYSVASLAAALMCGSALSVTVVGVGHAQAPQSAYAYVTANLNQRAGPATRFPSLGLIPSRTQIRINGCLQDLSWCEGAVGDVRGWMSANYLRLYDYRQQAWVEVDDYATSTLLPRYSFDLDRYWAQHYADRAFYPQRAAWLAPPSSPPIDNGVFYRELSPYGRWVSLDNRYVWMPDVQRGWRPYTDGRWEYTQRYGWTWVSNEPFGWATYHYGRWAYSNRLGWVWQPGTQWAPAWVAWRGSEDHLAWAPLPPDAGPGYRGGEDFAEIPRYYWQVVPAQDFLQANLINVIVGGNDRQRYDWLDRARPIGTATVVNNVVVNNVVNVDYVEQKTRKKVVPREVVITNRDAPARAGMAPADDTVVRIYQPPVAEAPATASPPAVLPANVAESRSQTAGQAGDEPATDSRLAEVPPAEEAVAPPTEAPPLAPEEAEAEQPAPAPASEAPAAQPPEEQPAPPAVGEPAPPPPPQDEAAPSPASDEATPPADEVTPAPQTEEPVPPPQAEKPAPPPAAAEEPTSPPAPDEAAPPPPQASEPPPPPQAEEPAPPPAAAVEEPAPPPAPEEAAPPPQGDEPPPPPPQAEKPASPPAAAEEPAAPPPDEAAPPPSADEPPPPPQAEEPASPPAAAEEPAAPPPDEAAPPPPADEPPPPPQAEEPAPPPPAAAEEPAPPLAPEEAAPPPQADEPPPPPPAVEEPAPPPPAAEVPSAPPPQAAPAPDQPKDGGGKDRKAKNCPDGKRLNNKGECVPRKK